MKLTTEEIFNLRKAMGEIFGMDEADRIWFKILLPDKKLRELIEKHKDVILGCLKQSDANFVYDSDEVIVELEKLLEESKK